MKLRRLCELKAMACFIEVGIVAFDVCSQTNLNLRALVKVDNIIYIIDLINGVATYCNLQVGERVKRQRLCEGFHSLPSTLPFSVVTLQKLALLSVETN